MKTITSLILVVSFIVFAFPYRTIASAPSDYISCWNLDEASGDRVDSNATNSNDLSPNGTPGNTTGVVGSALDTSNTANTSLDITDAAQSGLDITGDISIATWINLDATEFYPPLVTKYLTTGNNRSYLFGIDSGSGHRPEFSVSADGTSSNLNVYEGDSTLSTGTNYHLAMTYDVSSETFVLYVNGSSAAFTQTLNNGTVTSIKDGTGAFFLGSRDGAGEEMDGWMDVTEIYDRVLSSDEVTALYNSGSGVACDDRAAAGEDPTYQTGVFNGNAILRGNAVIK